MTRMLDVNTLKAKDLKGLSKSAVSEFTAALLARLATQQAAITAKDEHIARRDREIKFKDARIERITFESARLKAWKFGAKPEAMSASCSKTRWPRTMPNLNSRIGEWLPHRWQPCPSS